MTHPKAYQGNGAETEFLGTQQAGHSHVMGCFELTVALQHHPVTLRPFCTQGLLGFGKTQLPGQATIADGGLSGEAPVPPTSPLIRTTSAPALATPAATVPNPHLGNQFDVDPGSPDWHTFRS
jgi:hypothetical protein